MLSDDATVPGPENGRRAAVVTKKTLMYERWQLYDKHLAKVNASDKYFEIFMQELPPG